MKIMTASELKKKLDKDEVLLVDVREPAENKSECIEGACLIPLGEISVEKLPSMKKPIVIHCRSGKRSVAACAKLLSLEPSLEVYSLEGGILAWQELGYKVKKSGTICIALERQTQIAAGSIAFVGTILGAFVHSFFYIFPAFVGLGLILAGVTGWCGMAKLLAKMPWNQ